jgi:diguanylate cyclase (GGDEF)-like protein
VGVNFTFEENCVLIDLLAENASDIVLKTDCQGYVVHALPEPRQLGLCLPGGPIGRHILDFVPPSRAEEVRSAHGAAIAGCPLSEGVEFPVSTIGGRERWFRLQIRGLIDEKGESYGAIGIMRCIDDARSLEQRLFAATLTDPLTGLTNRAAFVAMLGHMVERDIGGSMAVFGLDHFKALNYRHGHAAGDEILVGFSELIQSLTRPDDIISRIGGESFGLLLPRTTLEEAEAQCARIVATLAEIGAVTDGPAVTASAGVAEIGASLDATIRAAELALAVAKAKGRNRVESGRRAIVQSSIGNPSRVLQ